MSFGFAVGDFIAVGGVITDIISCLKDSTGSKSDYQELVRELEALARALKSLDKLKSTESSPSTVDSIKCAALSCRVPLEQFLSKIQQYEPTLGPRASSPSPSVVSSSKAVVRKIKWLTKAEDIDRLRKYLNVHLGTINILLLEHGLETLEVTSQAMQEQYGNIQSSLRGIDRALTSTATSISGQTAMVRTSNNILTTLFSMISGEIRSSLSQITHFTQNASLICQRVFEAVVQLQSSVSAMNVDARWSYFQSPVRVEDALGRVFPVPSEYSMCQLHAILRYRFRKGPGDLQVRHGDFILTDRRNKRELNRSSMPELQPGLDIIMSIVIDVATKNGRDSCPVALCASQNTVPAPWGRGRTCLECGRWFVTSFGINPGTSKRKRRIEEVSSEESTDEKEDSSSYMAHFRNISCVLPEPSWSKKQEVGMIRTLD
ncbi:hypothetical protein V8F20_012840 [Naviculisporaceae sp. PSN 640]